MFEMPNYFSLSSRGKNKEREIKVKIIVVYNYYTNRQRTLYSKTALTM